MPKHYRNFSQYNHIKTLQKTLTISKLPILRSTAYLQPVIDARYWFVVNTANHVLSRVICNVRPHCEYHRWTPNCDWSLFDNIDTLIVTAALCCIHVCVPNYTQQMVDGQLAVQMDTATDKLNLGSNMYHVMY